MSLPIGGGAQGVSMPVASPARKSFLAGIAPICVGNKRASATRRLGHSRLPIEGR
jgi:hypothetical protein